MSMLGKFFPRWRSGTANRPDRAEGAPTEPIRKGLVRPVVSDRMRRDADAIVASAVRWVRAGGPAWRLGKHSVYRLPWYLVVGERGAGKSTLARAFGQRPQDHPSPASAASGETLLRGWFGKDAVLFEATLGEPESEAVWHALIRRLRRVRGACPANGVVVTVSVRQLVDSDDAARARYADGVRQRIDECHRLWKRRLPVYLLVTQCDRLTGFEAFCGDSTDEARASSLGLVFPLATNASDDASPGGAAHGFDALMRAARAQVVARMPVRADAYRAAMTFGFPEAFNRLAAPLSEFLRNAFEASPGCPETPLLRGVHFCAVATTPAAVNAYASDSASVTLPAAPALHGASGSERPYFIEGFFRRAVFQERGLARSRLALPHRRIVIARVMTAACALMLACAAIGLVTAYRHGSTAVAATAPAAAALVRAAQAGVELRSPRAMLALLDEARALPCGKAWQEPGQAWLVGLDLVREVHLERACRSAYATVLRETVQPYVIERMKAQLGDASDTPAKQFQTLRAYSMLGAKAHYDGATVLAWIEEDASRLALSPAERAAWLAHCAAWADAAALAPAVPLDAKLVGEARARLLTQPRAQRIFDALMPALRAAVPEPLSVAEMAGPAAALVFYRKSGARLSDGVPGVYTLAGLGRYFGVRDAALAQGRRDDWILGRPASATAEPGELAASVDRLYFAAYAQAWDTVIDDVRLRPLPGSGDAASLVSLLAGHDSPLQAFLARVAKETTIAGAASARAAAARAPDRVGIVGRKVRQWFSGAAPATQPPLRLTDDSAASASLVDEHFAALHRLVAGSGERGSGALGEVQAQLKELAVYLRAADTARGSGLPAPADDALDRLTESALTLPEPVGDMLGSLAREGTTSAQSAQRNHIERQWRAEAGAFCHAAIDGRYPFFSSGGDEVTPDDFARLFAPGGLLDTFFQTYLKPYVDTSATPWVWRPRIAPPGMPVAALREFERAAQIRDAFFPGGSKTMAVHFALTPRDMDPGLTRFVLADGTQTLDYAHGPPRAASFDWPDRAGARAARIEFAPAGPDGRQSVQTHGAWALFRLLDFGRLDARAADRFVLTYVFDGRSVVLDLAASSVVNPFAAPALHAFRCPSGF